MSRYYIDLADAKDTPPFLDRRDLACRAKDVDPEWFYPHGASTGALGKAIAVCNRCPARLDCLTWAIDTGQAFGVWGATTDEERRRIKRQGGQVAA